MGKIMLNGIQYGVGGIEQAKDISYDNTESGATATDVQGALDELNAGLPTLLWTNPSPSSDFAAQTVSIDLTDYKFVEVYCLNGTRLVYSKTLVGEEGVSMYFTGSSSTTYGTISEIRPYNVQTTGIIFTDNTQAYTGSANAVVNSFNKPKYIYGIK